MKLNETVCPSYLYLKKYTCPPVQLNNKQLTQHEEVKYLRTLFFVFWTVHFQ